MFFNTPLYGRLSGFSKRLDLLGNVPRREKIESPADRFRFLKLSRGLDTSAALAEIVRFTNRARTLFTSAGVGERFGFTSAPRRSKTDERPDSEEDRTFVSRKSGLVL